MHISATLLNVSIRWVNNSYDINEDSIGLWRVPDTRAETLYKVISDALNHCTLPISLCRGKAYDDAANMLGRSCYQIFER